MVGNAVASSRGGGGGGAPFVNKDEDVRDADGVWPLHQQVVSGQVRPRAPARRGGGRTERMAFFVHPRLEKLQMTWV